jgi:RNA polymerase sigma factor (sigma-70 family)
MVNGSTNTALRQVARVFQEGTLTGLSDGQMLERFVESRDEAAFEVLVGRHGPMVFNVCRQLLRDSHDVEDAFQAVFLVLVRKAGVIRVEGSLGPWLYSVANRVAARARANRQRSATRGLPEAAEIATPQSEFTLDRDETAVVIQEELARLPERLRAPLVLCYLQGMTHDLAAGQLGCPVGTVRSRLSRGRAQLLIRMTRRGLTLSAAGLVSALESNARAAPVPPIVRIALIKLATGWGSETAAKVGGLGASASVATLLEGVLNVMRIKKLAILATVLMGVGALSLVIVDRAAAVGGSQLQEAAATSGDPATRPVGPDGRTIGAVAAKPDTEFFTQTYYVGDILGVMPPAGISSTSPETKNQGTYGVRPKVDMQPVMSLISSTIAPRTWQMGGALEDGGDRKTNKMVPFFLSISLIIRCPQDVHAQVANLLRGLRGVLEARDARMVRPDPIILPGTYANPASAALPAGQSRPPAATVRDLQTTTLSPPAHSSPAQPPSKHRVQQLLDELQKEIARFPSPTGTGVAPSTADTGFAPTQ